MTHLPLKRRRQLAVNKTHTAASRMSGRSPSAGNMAVAMLALIAMAYTAQAQAGAGGNNYLDGGDGADELSGGGKDDELFGHNGADLLIGNGAEVTLAADQGDDLLDGEAGNGSLYGDADDDRLWDDGIDALDAARALRPHGAKSTLRSPTQCGTQGNGSIATCH